MNTVRQRIVAGMGLVLLGIAVLAIGLYDLYEDWLLQNGLLVLTVLENAVPLALTVVLIGVGIAVATGTDRFSGDPGAVAGWALLSAVPASLVGLWTVGFQHVQGTPKIHVVVAYMAVWGGIAGTFIGVYDGKQRKQKRTLAAQREGIARRERIQSALRKVTYGLVSGTTRDEIQQTTCDDLVDGAPFRAAWIGTVDDGEQSTDVVSVLASAGDVERSGEGDTHGETAAKRAAETGKATLTDRGDGPATAAAAPVAYEETRYGVLVVRGEAGHRLTDVEGSTLSDLGEMVGYAISATKTKRALTSDSAVGVEFELTAADHWLAAASERDGGQIALEGTVETAGSMVGVFSIRDGDPESVRELVTEEESVEEAELVEGAEPGGLIEVEFVDSALYNLVANRGGVVRESVSEDGKTRIRVEFPVGTDVRDVLEALQSEYPSASMTARRDIARPVRTDRAAGERVDRELTERQRTALKTAYLTGYYESPRRRTGEEIAETMDVSGPTFHKHLRLGERKLIEAYLQPGMIEDS
jgi:predicted DNA binding protein